MSAQTPASESDRTTLATVRSIAGLRAAVAAWRREGLSVGLVPLALIRRSRADCARTVASLFVNPTQFNDPKDLKAYPRDEAADAALFAAEGTDLLFAPPADEVYPAGFATQVRVTSLGD
jgi:pantoate--beta-alanine ligase